MDSLAKSRHVPAQGASTLWILKSACLSWESVKAGLFMDMVKIAETLLIAFGMAFSPVLGTYSQASTPRQWLGVTFGAAGVFFLTSQ